MTGVTVHSCATVPTTDVASRDISFVGYRGRTWWDLGVWRIPRYPVGCGSLRHGRLHFGMNIPFGKGKCIDDFLVGHVDCKLARYVGILWDVW